MKRVALALLLLASPAEATKRYGSPVGSDTLSGGTNPCTTQGSPCRTLARLFSSASNNDSLYLGHSAGVIASGRYADQMTPQRRNLRVFGDSAKPNAVVVPGFYLYAGTGMSGPNYTGFYMNGVRVNGGTTVKEDPCCGDADNVLFRNCVFNGSTIITDINGAMYSCRVGVGRDSTSTMFHVRSTSEPVSFDLYDNTVIAAPVSTPYYTDYGIALRTDDTEYNWLTLRAARNRFTIFHPATYDPPKSSFLSGWKNCVVNDNSWSYIDSSGATSSSNSTGFGWLFRDHLTGNRIVRDTFTLETLVANKGKGTLHIVGSGSNQYAFNEGSNNTWRYCLFKSNIPPSAPPIDFWYQMQPGDSFTRNVVVTSTGAANTGFHINNVKGNAYVYRNTFLNIGTGGAVMVNHDQAVCAGRANCCWGGTLEFKGNIVASRSGNTAMALSYGPNSNQPVVSDYNLFSNYVGGPNRQIVWAPCGQETASYSISGWSAASTGFGTTNDAHSVYGSPRFTDSSYSAFNPLPLSSSAALGAGPGGSDIGAIDFYDAIRPEEITDLYAVSATTKTVRVTWSDTGDDSLTGTASSYVLKYSTSEITALNFDSATSASVSEIPSAPGTARSVTVGGLNPGTTYYFAIKIYDEFGNPSAISNLASRTTADEGEGGHAEP